MVGGYDNIAQPSVVAKDYDYILFTNDIPEQQLGVWSVRSIPYYNKDNTRIARWVKTHPHVLLSDYEYSLWMDSNVQVDVPEFYSRIDELIACGSLIASMDHLERDCIYDEAYAIIYYNLDRIGIVLKWLIALKRDKYPRHIGMIETNCVLRQHNSTYVAIFCNEWWNVIEKYSKRDQLSFNYVAWKLNIRIDLILPKGKNTRNHKWLHCIPHQKKLNIEKTIWHTDISHLFKIKCNTIFNNFIESKSHSLEELTLYYKIKIIHKYCDLVVKKYKYCTKAKKMINQICDL